MRTPIVTDTQLMADDMAWVDYKFKRGAVEDGLSMQQTMQSLCEALRCLREPGRSLRPRGDMLLAFGCMTHGHGLCQRDADFQLLKTHRGLDTWLN